MRVKNSLLLRGASQARKRIGEVSMNTSLKQRVEMERLLSNWKKYLDSIPPASDDLKLHKWLGMNTAIVKKDHFNRVLRSFVYDMRARLDALPQ